MAERFHVTCSVGIACNKLVSKMASTNAKPDGMLLIPAARSAEFVQMMPLRGIPGIGPLWRSGLMLGACIRWLNWLSWMRLH